MSQKIDSQFLDDLCMLYDIREFNCTNTCMIDTDIVSVLLLLGTGN